MNQPSQTSELDYSWTTGYTREVTHESRIGAGGFGEVHKVINPAELVLPYDTLILRCLLLQRRRYYES